MFSSRFCSVWISGVFLHARWMKTMIDSSLSLRYKIALATIGMCDGLHSSLSTSERMERLEAYRTSKEWGRLKYTVVPHLVGRSSRVGTSGSTRVSWCPQSADLFCDQIQSDIRGVEDRHWRIDVGAGFRGMCMDASQDLLILKQETTGTQFLTKYHVLQLSTGAKHSSAKHSGIIDLVSSRSRVGINTSVCGSYISEVVQGPSRRGESSYPRLCIWNWKAGSLEMEVIIPDPGMAPAYSFLDEEHIIALALPTEWDAHALQVFYIQTYPRLPGTPRPRPSHLFLLPKLAPGVADVQVALSTSPINVGSQRPGHFYADPHVQLLPIKFTIKATHREFALYVPSSTISSYMCQHPRDSKSGQPVVVPWDSWGPVGSHMMPMTHTHPQSWLTHAGLTVNGLRTICLPPRVDNKSHMLSISDYHSGRIMLAMKQGSEDDVRHETVIIQDDLGTGCGPLRTMLPCLVKEIPLPDELMNSDLDLNQIGFSICEDGVLVFEHDDNLPAKIKRAWTALV
ncbi:hypothetical protein BV25DRAFT_999849 [Artomyces pyxidatus]|uniref:Uncharacterized protein n=1 Tax=Artomyces pyxidatus TaxID=48021 RepID=A0ACB8SUA6_9AGAM|nr:hypothetical protein BV25DRAFT_999849 [Artomyces pyxidatus]